MNFEWTPEEQALRDQVTAALDLPDLETGRAALEHASSDPAGALLRETLRALAPTGYLARGVGETATADRMALLAAQEVVAEACAVRFVAAETTARLFAGLVAASPLAEAWLPRVHAGSLLAAVARHDGGEVTTEARPAGDGWVLSGTKPHVALAPVADVLAITARLEGAPLVAVVPRDAPGLEIGPRQDTLGYRGLPVAAVTLRDLRVTRDQVILPAEAAAAVAGLDVAEDLMLTLAAQGSLSRALAHAQAHTATHLRDGKPSQAHQAVRFRLAELLTLKQTAQLFIQRAVWLRGPEAGPDHAEADTVLRAAKVFVTEAAETVASAALQLTAGAGFLSGNPAEQAYRDVKLPGVAGTPLERCRVAIADDVLARHPV